MALTNNFYRETGKVEPRVSKEEENREIKAFLDAVLMSKPMVEVYNFLKKKGHPYAANPTVWADKIKQLWFEHYSRSRGAADSSGFEHVFIGEASSLEALESKTFKEKNGEVSGLHNWVRFYALEKNATENFDYKGFIVKR
ncbi:Endoribonuclease XendoU, partial [Trichostrongylus colubriformis]